jgi:chromosome segregation ATPase
MSFKRQTNQAGEKREAELESIKDKLGFYKKNVERLTSDKDRLKIKLKQAEDSKAELKQRIQDFEMLQETLNLDRKRIDE